MIRLYFDFKIFHTKKEVCEFSRQKNQQYEESKFGAKIQILLFCVIFRYLNFRAKIEPIRLLSFGAKIQIFEKRFDYILTFKAKKIEFGLKHF